MTRDRLDEDALLAIGALASVAAGLGVGAGVIKAIRTIKAFMAVGKKDAAETALKKLSYDDQRILHQLAAERAGRDARRAAQHKPVREGLNEALTPGELKRLLAVNVADIADPGKMHTHLIRLRDYRNAMKADQLPDTFYRHLGDHRATGRVPKDPWAISNLEHAHEQATARFGELRKPKNEASEYDDLIGREWTSKAGPRKVVGIALVRGEPRLRIQTGDANQHELLPPAELEGEIKRDTQQAARKPAAAVPEPAFAYQAFLDTMSPMQAARARAALTKNRIHRGDLMTVSAIVSKLVASGSTVQDSKTGRRLVAQDGSYLDEKQITKFGMDLAAYLTRKNESNMDEATDPVWAHYAAPKTGKHVPTGSPNYDAHMANKPKTWTLVGVNHADINLAGVRKTLASQYGVKVVTVKCDGQPPKSVKQPSDAGEIVEALDEMAKLSARGRKELLRLSKATDTPDGDLTTWSRTTTAYMSDGRILKKRDVRFKPDSFSETGRKHSHGWKDTGRMKPALVENPAALRRALEKLRDDAKAQGYEIEADTLYELPQSPLTGGGMGEDMDEGKIDFHAEVPTEQSGRFMEIVRAYAEDHIVGNAGKAKKGIVVVNGTLSDEKGRRGNFIDGVRDRGITGVKVGGKLIETHEEIAQALAEGRSTTPPYVYGMFNASGGSISTEAAWRVSGRGANVPGYGKPNEANLKKMVEQYNASLEPGGANDHLAELGMERMTAVGGYIRRNEGRGSAIVAKWGKIPARFQGDVWESKGSEAVWGKPYAEGNGYVTKDGKRVEMRRKGSAVRFYTADGEQVGPEHKNVAPAVAAAMAAGWKEDNRSSADEADVMEVLAPFQCLLEAVQTEPEATEVMRISTRPKPQPEGARGPYVSCAPYPSDSYMSFCVYDDGTVVRDGYKNGRSTRAVIARVDAAALADTVSALKALAGEFNPDYGIADISMSVSESLDEATIDTGNADVPEIGFVRGNYYLKTAKGLKNSPAEKGDRAKRRTRFREMLRNEFNVSNADALIQKLDAMDEAVLEEAELSVGDRVCYGTDPRAKGFELPEREIGTVEKVFENAGVTYAKVKFAGGKRLSYPVTEFTKIEEGATSYETRWGLVEVSPPGWKGSVEAMKRDQRKGKMDKGINPFALAWSMKKKGAKPHYKADGTKKDESLDEAHDRFPPLGVSSPESAARAEAAGFVLEGTEVGQEILRQLGGGKFVAMTGAKNFVGGENTLAFRVGRNDKGVNYVRITLDPSDTYTVEFMSLRGTKSTVKSKVENVYVDSLRDVFTEGTGLYTSLGTMGRKPTDEAQDPAVKSMSARVKSYFKKHGPKDVRVRGSQGKSTFIEAWISRFNPENPHKLADVPGFPEDVRRKALVVIYGKDMGVSAGNVDGHRIVMSAAQWNTFLDQLEGKSSTNESEDGRQVAYLTGDDAERALKAIGSPNRANVALWLRKNLSRLEDMGTQDGGEFEDDYESSAVSVNVEGVPYTVRIGDDFVVVFCDESVDEAKVQVSGATYTLVKKNADGTATVRNDNGDEFDTEPGEKWTELADAPARVSGPDPRKLGRAAYIAAEKKAMQGTRQGNLDAVVARIEKEYQTKTLPTGITKVQHLLTAPRLKPADRALRTEYNVAKRNADADYRADELHWGRVWDRMNGKDEAVGSVDPMAAIRKILIQNQGRYYTADQLAKAIGASQSDVFKAASRLVTQGTAQFKRGEGYSLAGDPKALQLPAERAHQPRVSDRRTNDYTQRDAEKAARRKREESLAEEFAVVRGEKDALEYWTGEGWTDERGAAKLFDTQEESDAEAERLEQADETTTSGGVGGFRAFPLGKRPAAPINVGSIPDVAADDEEDDEADEDELDESDDPETGRFYMQLLRARSSPAKLKKLGYTVAEVDRMTSMMLNGAHKEDAIYATEQNRKKAKSADEDAADALGVTGARSTMKERLKRMAERRGEPVESMGVGDTSIEVVKRGSKWFVVPPDGTREQSFDDEKTATEVAQALATRENYAVVISRGTKKPVEETHGSADYVDVQWQDGRYTVTPPRSWDMKPGDQEEFDSIGDAYARALELAKTNFWVVLIWNLKPGDKSPTQGQTSPAEPSAAQGADEAHNEQERAPRGGDSPARPSAPKAAGTSREALSFDESTLERYVLAAQAAGVDLNTQVTYSDGSYSLRLPSTDAARVRELVGIS